MERVEAKICKTYLSLQLLSSAQMLLRISADDELRTCLFQKIIGHQTLHKQFQFIFDNIKDLYEVLQKIITANKASDIVIESNGKVHISFQVNIYHKTIKKTITFNLQQHLQPNQQIALLRANLQLARKEIDQLRQQVKAVAQENNMLKARYDYLEQLFISQPKRQQTPKKEPKTLIKQLETKIDISAPQQKQEIVIQQDISNGQIVPLKIQFDEKCMYYNKFKIQKNIVSSLFQDYYQIYLREPLPKKGIFRTRMKMIGQNHLSVGLLGKSALNNQYSFQNNKAICFYSYFYGNFRGIYYRTKYEPLNWNIEQGEILQIELNMNKKVFKIKLQGDTTANIINFQQLWKQEPLYFFLQMYEKNNIVQFIK